MVVERTYPEFYWLTPESREFLQRGYLLEGVTAEQRIREIAEYAERKLGIEGYADKFYNYMSKGWFSLSTPIWNNYGNQRGMSISCFSSWVDDSIEGITDAIAEISMMSKYGGGTSVYMGAVRPRGSMIRNNGKSNGSFSFLPWFESTINCVAQGLSRRGQCAAYIDIDHADIEEWLDIHTEGNPIQVMYYGVCVGNDWLEEMKSGDKRKRAIWAKVIQRRTETGIPYLFFKDNANNNKPEVYKDKNLTITNSNLCVSPDTTILTTNGHEVISEIVGEKRTIWNGYEWSEDVTIVKTAENQKLYRVTLSDGRYLDCTDYHEWSVYYDTNLTELVKVKTKDLHIGATVENWFMPELEGANQEVTKDAIITSIELVSESSDTYCVTEPLRHKAVFNGILTHQCNEIYLPINKEESFVCCLSSMNLLHYDEWKDTDAVKVLTYFLDSVMSEFIDETKDKKYMERARRFSERHRALGLGVLGWHSYLQANMIPFESFQAMQKNAEIFKHIKNEAYEASKDLAARFGEPEILKGYGRRNTTLMAIAPTKSSSFILGQVSPSIEPLKSNYFVKDLAKSKTVYKNPYLIELLQVKGKDTPEVWEDILGHDGSVQHLDFLTQNEKDVFKTFSELSQMTVIQQAAQRQAFIDQGQSINIMVHPSTPAKDINQLYLTAAELGLKGLYYQLSMSAAQVFNRNLLNTCVSCEA